MDLKEIRDEFRRSTYRYRLPEPERVLIPDVGHLRISTALRISANIIRVTMPRRKRVGVGIWTSS